MRPDKIFGLEVDRILLASGVIWTGAYVVASLDGNAETLASPPLAWAITCFLAWAWK